MSTRHRLEVASALDFPGGGGNHPARMPVARTAWLILPLIALVELGLHAWIRTGVANESEYRAAAAFVRAHWQPADAVTAAPSWADPVLRKHLGDRITLAMAGRSDLAAYDRLWTVSIRGWRAPEVAGKVPELEKSFGKVTVLRHRLRSVQQRYDLVAHLADAHVELGREAHATICRRINGPAGHGGGLGKGVVAPRERFECQPGARGFVAPVVLEDLALAPRHCVFQPALSRDPLRVRFPAVPLADELVFYAGLYYEDERMRSGAPVTMRVLVGGQERAKMVHRDGQGWVRMVVPTPAMGTAAVVVEVSSNAPQKRGFCWSGSTRMGGT